MRQLWIDTETFSPTPITAGTFRYMADLMFEVMLVTYALDDGPVRLWDRTAGLDCPVDLADALHDPAVQIVAHNAPFDYLAMSTFWPTPRERWHCTMVQALSHSLPGGLAKLCEVLRVATDDAKDKRGRQLIQRFCKPVNGERCSSATHPKEWREFCDYATQDIVAMRACHKRMPTWNMTDFERRLWLLDQEINTRGFKVDTDLAEAAVRATTREKARLARRTVELTDGEVERATQRDRLLAHILGEHGVLLPDLSASTLERRMLDQDLPSELRELLAVRLQASTASTSKYSTMLKAVNDDGRLRGALQFNGANRTGRWAGRHVQMQNFPRVTLPREEIDNAVEALKMGCEDLIYG